ncbi:MAG TPA: class I SAM-dependent methyltransferase [Anaerolineales bacterium]|nr:class I SAM-dependent methyltransferase [Anaerolineales bacterium]
MNDNQTGQVSHSAAEIYEEFFIPALFREWPARIINAAKIRAGQRVLDVACGTGVLARALAERVGPTGSVTGLDINEGMLAVAKRKAPKIEWRHGRAESLPFDNSTFDAVVSQFGLMFFEDRLAAVREMSRVLRPGGQLAVAVWSTLDSTPGYTAMAALLERLFGPGTAEALHAPYSLGDLHVLLPLFDDSGLETIQVTTIDGTARFPSIHSWVFTEIKGWTLSDNIDEMQYQHLLNEAEKELQLFVMADHTVEFRAPAHIITATRK